MASREYTVRSLGREGLPISVTCLIIVTIKSLPGKERDYGIVVEWTLHLEPPLPHCIRRKVIPRASSRSSVLKLLRFSCPVPLTHFLPQMSPFLWFMWNRDLLLIGGNQHLPPLWRIIRVWNVFCSAVSQSYPGELTRKVFISKTNTNVCTYLEEHSATQFTFQYKSSDLWPEQSLGGKTSTQEVRQHSYVTRNLFCSVT